MKHPNFTTALLLAVALSLFSSCSKDDCAQKTYYQDADGDGFGNAANSQSSCSQPEGYVANDTDPNDTDAKIFPNCTETTYYEDADGDGFGNAANSKKTCGTKPEGYVEDNTDTDDTNAQIFPGCDETTYYEDADGDGFGNPDVSQNSCVELEGFVLDNTDCDDTNANVNPEAEELPNDGIDSNCDGEHETAIWSGDDIEFTKAANADWTLPENQDHITDKVVFTRQDAGPMYNYQWWQDTFEEDATHINGTQDQSTSDLVWDFWNAEDTAILDVLGINPTGGTKGVRWALLDDTGAENPNAAWENFPFYGQLGDPTHFYSFHNLGTIVGLLNDGEHVTGVQDDFVVLNNENAASYVGMPTLEGKRLGVWLVEEDIYLTLTFTEWGKNNGGTVAYIRSTPANN
ncbi:MAG: putative metal-binding motif-containing protein [Allomuricauda sp.]